jgi:hypothetical protein
VILVVQTNEEEPAKIKQVDLLFVSRPPTANGSFYKNMKRSIISSTPLQEHKEEEGARR